jgi:hypothetical protein
MFVALAATVVLTSVAAGSPGAAKQRVAISSTILPSGKAVLAPVQNGALERDSGTFGGDWSPNPDRVVMRDGQQVSVHTTVWTLRGKRGSLVLRERTEWVDVGNRQGVAIGTWKVVRGTGQYAGIAGGGRSGHAGLGPRWFARYEGFLMAP